MNRWQWLLSSVIVVYLALVLIIPNGHSYIHHSLKSWLWPLANSLNIGYTWQFFSPDPSATIYYEYDLLKDNTLLGTRKQPAGEGRVLFRFNYTRRVALKNILSRYPDLSYSVFAPYFCKQYPQANYVKITKKMVKPISFEEARLGRSMKDVTKIYDENLGYEGCDNDI